EIALRNKWLTAEQVLTEARIMEKTQYGQYLFQLIGK
ncbi:TPA: glucose-1-phosphate thymidylyltransferase, partial [Escherichia coli]|nr:glucose-1-phosphate thymidylyltransferase [Escherichia coli]